MNYNDNNENNGASESNNTNPQIPSTPLNLPVEKKSNNALWFLAGVAVMVVLALVLA